MPQMSVVYTTESEFYNGIAQLVQRGLTFVAHIDNLSITLTGGY